MHEMDPRRAAKHGSFVQRVNRDLLGFAVLVTFLVPVQPLWGQTHETLANRASVIDGDTLEIEGEVVQLHGIDAPEPGQTCLLKSKRWRCGQEAAFALKRLAGAAPVACKPTSSDGPRTKAVCVSGSADLAEKMLQKGYAVKLVQAPPNYQSAELSARSARLGLWRSTFVRPWDWRQGVRLPGGPADEVTLCEVKGTINDQDQRVFYLPSDRGYGEITIDPSKGERMFCSDDAALLAGWKRFPRR